MQTTLATAPTPTARPTHERTCCVCGELRDKDGLVHLGILDGELVCEPKDGRGFYVCCARDCLQGLSPGTVKHGTKGAMTASREACERFGQRIGDLAKLRVLQFLGLARRQGSVVVGDAARDDGAAGQVLLCARDLSPRALEMAQKCSARPFLGARELGRAMGMERVGWVRVTHPKLARMAAYWWRVWYEAPAQGATRTG